jgi:asparagine synthase (glutamine-hydrolysing)
MCGITGFITKSRQYNLADTAKAMADTLYHRGPDDGGEWADPENRVALAHRRLAILDLSPAGHQPMQSHDERYILVFNGEIYNHLELRKQLDFNNWRSSSDTETLLACFSAWGIEKTLPLCHGMFALALWDRAEKTITLARDRMGEKPLYYGMQGTDFLFGSELKAIKAFPGFNNNIDRDALTLFLKHNYIPAPHSIYQEINKLHSGCYLKIKLASLESGALPEPVPYWSLKETVEWGKQNPFDGTPEDAIDSLEHVLTKSIKQQQISDVPLGAFLSGGIDSSLIVALMQKNSGQAVKTFTIGTDSAEHNEAEHAKAVAKHLGTEHTELYVSAQDSLDIIPSLPALYDEPFADSSQIPTYLVSKLAQQKVTVALSGDAGDELFAGYNRYFWAQNIWNKISWLPRPARKALSGLLYSLSLDQWDALNQHTRKFQPERIRTNHLGDKVHKLAERLATVHDLDSLYRSLVSEWNHPESVVLNGSEPQTILTQPELWPKLHDHRERMMYLDSMTYLQDDILTKVDRAAMGASLETRVPFLDQDVIRLAWQMPMEYKIHKGQGKWLLRQLLYRHVPREMIERPKSGFAIPVAQWLRGPLQEWADDLLDETKLNQQGYFDAKQISQRWREHRSGKRNWQYSLWSVLMFQAWLEDKA